ncbi:MAG: dicarboxylate/amino acid:cation symporter [Sphingomicrobium sp.]
MRGARPWWMLGALVLGLAAGSAIAFLDDGIRETGLRTAAIVGGLWLNSLKMTVVPLIVALLILGIAQGAEAARAGRLAARTMGWFVVIYFCSAVFGALTINVLLGAFPLPDPAIQALRSGLATFGPTTTASGAPPVSDFFGSIIPANAIEAAAEGDVLQLVVFTFLFALAATKIPARSRDSLLSFFEAVRDALLVLIGWVLWIAPIGVFALAFALATGAGGAAVAALAHYIFLLCTIGAFVGLSGYALAVIAGRRPLSAFAKAMLLPQSVAISTRSSLASIPAMLIAARRLGVRERVADVTFPMIGALFRPTGPAMNVAVAFYVAHWLGLEPSAAQIAAAIAVATVISFGAISVPGEASFITSIAPIGMALGVPIAPLALLVAVEMIPDIFRTVGNVTIDVGVTTAVDRSTGNEPES